MKGKGNQGLGISFATAEEKRRGAGKWLLLPLQLSLGMAQRWCVLLPATRHMPFEPRVVSAAVAIEVVVLVVASSPSLHLCSPFLHQLQAANPTNAFVDGGGRCSGKFMPQKVFTYGTYRN